MRTLPASQYMMAIITEFGKFRYNPLPTKMCASEDTCQSKVDKLISGIKVVKTYINYILVLLKERFSKNIY